jgi:LPXTG-motif cell wall-anchored protein
VLPSERIPGPSEEFIVTIGDEGVPADAGIFEIGEEEVPHGMMMPKTGDTSIPFVLLTFLLTGSAAGMIILIRRIRQFEE